MFTIHADPLGHDSFTADVRISVISQEPASSRICRVQVLDSEELPLLDDPSLEELPLYEKDILRIPGRRFPLTVIATECGTNKVFQGGPFLTNAEICFPNIIECAKIGTGLATIATEIALDCGKRTALQIARIPVNISFLATLAAMAAALALAFAALLIPFIGGAIAVAFFVSAGILASQANNLKQQLDKIDQQIADLNAQIQKLQSDYSTLLGQAQANCCPLTDLLQKVPGC